MIQPYYEDAAVRLYHGDCLEVLPQLEPVDHVITDPPYSILVVNTSARGRTEGEKRKGQQTNATRRDLGYQGVDDSMRLAVAREVGRLARRWAMVFCDAESLTAWRIVLESAGLRHIRSGAWVSPACTPQFTGDRPGTGWEACQISHASGRCRWNGGGSPAVWVFNRPVNGSEDRREAGHPTPKPVLLLTRILADFTDAGETILDPFSGSGTLGIAAKLNGRKAILIEREEKYCEIAAKRLRETEPGRLFDKPTRAKPQSFLSAMGEPERELREDPVLRESHADGNA
jgi:DNA modification methylase